LLQLRAKMEKERSAHECRTCGTGAAGMTGGAVAPAFAGTLLPSAAAEEALDVGELELDVGGAAVVALAGVGRRLHLAQQGVHLLH